MLYNFFGSSPLKNQWRVVYEYMKEQDLLNDTSLSFPSFDTARHNLLSSELKQLYVAITRTRQRLWISESVEDLSKPMFDYWKRKGLVQVRKLDDSLAQAMQVASSSEEWKSRGKKVVLLKLFGYYNFLLSFLQDGLCCFCVIELIEALYNENICLTLFCSSILSIIMRWPLCASNEQEMPHGRK